MSYIVTGAGGFIGSNLVKALNERGESNIIAVDILEDAGDFANLADCEIADYLNKDDFLKQIQAGAFDGRVRAILHQGACSDTMETDCHYMLENNYEYTLALLDHCRDKDIPFIYASSASVYGAGRAFKEMHECEAPLNAYALSKLLIDRAVRRHHGKHGAQVVGLRYFNVYGEGEAHKGRMASVAYHFYNQYRAFGRIQLFEGSGGYPNGGQLRDFVSIEDVIRVNLHFLDHPEKSGIFNLGTGQAQTFNDVAMAVINNLLEAEQISTMSSLEALQKDGLLAYAPIPVQLHGKYQSYTQADISALRNIGYAEPFLNVEQGVRKYVAHLLKMGS